MGANEPPVGRRVMLDAKVVKERLHREFQTVDQAIPTLDEMPVLKAWVESHERQRPLAGVTALLIQHRCGDHVPLAEALLRLGLNKDGATWLDIPYTSNPAVRAGLANLGIPGQNLLVHEYRVLEPYAPYQLRRVQRILRELLANPPERLLVLDDGAYFLEAMATLETRFPNVTVVEQTTRGLIKMEENAAICRCAQDIPVVNVARSKPKKVLESPFIGMAVGTALESRLRGSSLALREEDRCLVLGYGTVGCQVAMYLEEFLHRPRTQIYVHDPDPSRVEKAQDYGFSRWDRKDFETCFRLVVGCSGRSSFTVGDHVYLDRDAVLASASSGSVELSRQDFIELADCSDLDDLSLEREGLNEANVHSDLRFRLVEKRATFLNGGFPVNFVGRVNIVPARFMQATATLMAAGAVQAANESRKGLIDLAPDFCNRLDGSFREALGEDAVLLPARED